MTVYTSIKENAARVLAVISAVLILLAAFGLHISGQQDGAIVGLATSILALLTGETVRAQVVPTAKIRRLGVQAHSQGFDLGDADPTLDHVTGDHM